MGVSVRFEQTTKGHVGYVKHGNRERLVWFIREEMNFNRTESLNLFGVYRSEDGGRGFRQIPRVNTGSNEACYYDNVNAAKAFVYGQALPTK